MINAKIPSYPNRLILILVCSSTSFVCALKCVCASVWKLIPFIRICLVGHSAVEQFTHTAHHPSDRSGLAACQREQGSGVSGIGQGWMWGKATHRLLAWDHWGSEMGLQRSITELTPQVKSN